MNGNGSGARERIKEAYAPETYERLLALKAKYDPDNVFRFSYQLVPPESSSPPRSSLNVGEPNRVNGTGD